METVVSPEVLKAAKARLKEKYEEAGWGQGDGTGYGSPCNGSVMGLDGKILQVGHTACHSWVSYAFRDVKSDQNCYGFGGSKYKEGAKPFLVITCHGPTRSAASPEATKAIIEWFARGEDSPFKQFFVNADDDESLFNYGAILFCGPGGLSHNQTMWICKALRYATEGSQSLDVWNTLYKGGVHPILSLLVANYIPSFKGKVFKKGVVSVHVTVFNEYVDLHAVMNFRMDDKATTTQTLFQLTDKERQELVKGAAFGKKAFNSAQIIGGFTKKIVKDDGWGGKIEGEGVDGAELVKRVLAWQEELGGYNPVNFPGPVVEVRTEEPLMAYLPDATTVYLDVDL